MNINERISYEIETRGEYQLDLAKSINEPKSKISTWLSGGTLIKYANIFIGIAKHFGWSVNYLVTGEESHSLFSEDEQQLLDLYKSLSKEDQIRILERAQTLSDIENQDKSEKSDKSENSISFSQPQKKMINIYTVAAGAGISIPFDEDDKYEKRSFDIDIIPNGTTCGIPINGKSMEPNYPDGCIVWVHETEDTEDVKPGDDVIAVLDGEPYCKIYEEDGLHSYNPEFETIHVNEDDHIQFLGKIIGYYVEEPYEI